MEAFASLKVFERVMLGGSGLGWVDVFVAIVYRLLL